MARDFTADYKAARMAAMTARENGDLSGKDARRADAILKAADKAGVDVPIATVEREVGIAHGLPVWPPAS